ncbi:putative mannitol dehydrogenase [Vitis vinifera]|uniref:Putative mannitol dehydrogenase n=1 Tax=Vitis vinifera TaxID=29760 RepID=A0A438FC99_VITVI|nr:putative mannitol dehydrogenase [Vitis vinifera]
MAKSAEQEHPTKAFGWAATDTSGVLSPFKFSRRETGEKDVRFKVLYCGICHSDLHMAKNDWGMSTYPIVPGDRGGKQGRKVQSRNRVGVGCIVGACHSCDICDNDLENYCPKMIFTYSAPYHDGTTTYGGYSDVMVAEERYVVRIPDNLPLDTGAPLLCAGITVYSPLQHFGLTKTGMHIGVQEEGSHRTPWCRLLLVSRDPDQMQAAMGTMDGIIDTVSAVHPLLPLIGLLKFQGKLVMVGGPNKPLELPVFPLLMGRKVVAGSCTGGMKEIQEMIDFAGNHNITADVEVFQWTM